MKNSKVIVFALIGIILLGLVGGTFLVKKKDKFIESDVKQESTTEGYGIT